MTAPTVTVKIDRSGLAVPAADLVASGTRAGSLFGIVRFIPPAMIARTGYMPNSRYVDGSEETSVAWEEAILGFDWIPLNANAASETAVQAAYAEMIEAIGQIRFSVKTQVSGAPEQAWRGTRGSMVLGGSNGRTYVDLQYRVPVYGVTIPVHPIAS